MTPFDMHKPVVVVGSINLDFVARTRRIPAVGETVTGTSFQNFFGGKGANQAVGVARLGYPVAMIGRVGDDEYGERLRQGLSDAGVDVGAVRRAPGVSSGAALISVAAGGGNSIIVVPGANGLLTPADLEAESPTLSSAGIILMQLEVPLSVVAFVAEFAWPRHIPVALDPAPARKLPSSLIKKIAWLTPNETEARTLCGIEPAKLNHRNTSRYAAALLEMGPQNVVIKLGELGALWAGADGGRVHVPAFKVRSIDSTAAGDAFSAGLAVALMKGSTPPDAVRFASAVAALSVTRAGAQPSMPSADEVARFIAAKTRRKRT